MKWRLENNQVSIRPYLIIHHMGSVIIIIFFIIIIIIIIIITTTWQYKYYEGSVMSTGVSEVEGQTLSSRAARKEKEKISQ